MALALSLSKAQIAAANRLHGRMAGWVLTDRSLAELGRRFPEWEPEATLLKVVAVNSLYGTNVWAVSRMAEHVHAVMAATDVASAGPELVEKLAALRGPGGEKVQRRHISFASKLAHFYVDSARYPIYDSYARWMVWSHLGRRNWAWDRQRPYQSYCEMYERLKVLAGLDVSNRELDRYLWLSCQYRLWRRNREALINSEARAVFELGEGGRDDSPWASEVAKELGVLGSSNVLPVMPARR